jgi:prophage DNA circulation protein
MSWRDRYRPASFRGVPFLAEQSERTSSRRIVSHNFAYRKGVEHDDLGENAEDISLNAIVVGENYDETADELEIKCRQPGAGLLIHPHIGRLSVVCLRCRRSENVRDGRMARFGLTFQSSRTILPEPPKADIPRLIDDAGSDLAEVTETATDARMAVAGVAEFLRTSASDAMTQMSDVMSELDIFSGPANEVAAFQQQLTDLINQTSTLVTSPVSMVQAIFALVDAVEDAAGNAIDSLAAYEGILGEDPIESGGASAQSLQADENAAAVVDTFRYAAARGAIKAAAVAAIDGSFLSFEEATTARSRVVTALDKLLLTAPDEVYQQLMTLQSLLVEGVPGEDSDLPRIGSFTPAQTIPSLVLAYRLYDDIDRDAELIDRNALRHPGFVAPDPLEVLRDATSPS